EPPVASIGSTKNTVRPLKSSGKASRYGTGSWVSSLRAMPIKPTWASGIIDKAGSIMPRPARIMGTIIGGSSKRVPSRWQQGFRIRSAQPEDFGKLHKPAFRQGQPRQRGMRHCRCAYRASGSNEKKQVGGQLRGYP